MCCAWVAFKAYAGHMGWQGAWQGSAVCVVHPLNQWRYYTPHCNAPCQSTQMPKAMHHWWHSRVLCHVVHPVVTAQARLVSCHPSCHG